VSLRTLHPAARRRVLATTPNAHPHDIVLRPIDGGGAEAMIVSAGEEDFVGAILADVQRPDRAAALAARRGLRRGAGGTLALHQPINRRFHLVLLEAVCRDPGYPRVDPKKLEGMGFVLRRQTAGREGWTKRGKAIVGWRTILAEDADPDPARRLAVGSGQAGAIGAMIAARRGDADQAEDILPLFFAPPPVCAAAGKTLLYGVIPVTSADRSPGAPDDYARISAEDDAEIRKHFSEYLRPRPPLSMPRAGDLLSPAWKPLDIAPDAVGEDGQLRSFALFLQQLKVEIGVGGASDAAAVLMDRLATLRLPMERIAGRAPIETIDARSFVTAAIAILIDGAANNQGLTMPFAWPRIDDDLGGDLTDLAMASIAQRFAAIMPDTPKYDGDDRIYAVRGFVRVKGPPGCASKLVWSDYAEPFRILPWWDGDGPATKISLPDVTNFRSLKPNVSFVLPGPLANLLQGDMSKLKDGDGSTDGPAIAWLCSFSLPIITLCAFIVLNIFLSLFNIVFGWLAFIKICIPIPRSK